MISPSLARPTSPPRGLFLPKERVPPPNERVRTPQKGKRMARKHERGGKDGEGKANTHKKEAVMEQAKRG